MKISRAIVFIEDRGANKTAINGIVQPLMLRIDFVDITNSKGNHNSSNDCSVCLRKYSYFSISLARHSSEVNLDSFACCCRALICSSIFCVSLLYVGIEEIL